MNESGFYYKIVRNLLFASKQRSLEGIKYYLYTTRRLSTLAATRPIYFLKKLSHNVIRSPGKILDVVKKRYELQDWRKNQKRLQNEYQKWIDNIEKPNLDIEKQKDEINKFLEKPLISIITPVFNPPVKVHKELIESVLNQTYTNFELLLYNFGNNPEVVSLLNRYAEKDKRIIVKQNLENRGISKNSNLCLEDVKGEFVALLDHDDSLMPNALFECVKAINTQDLDFIYTDKDKITEDGIRFEPFFKPDWSPELELGGNYLTHFNLMRTKLIKNLGGWDSNTDGAQDWDLFWRILEKTDRIVHIPKILYHWRTVKGSTSNQITAKPYVMSGQHQAVGKHLKAIESEAISYHNRDGQLYIKWPSKKVPRTFIIQIVYKNIKSIEGLINKIKNQKDYMPGSSLLVFCLQDDFAKKHKKQLRVKYPELTIIEYVAGEFIKSFLANVQLIKTKNIFYMSDSTKSVKCIEKNSNWSSQLEGWLSIEKINIAGGLSLAHNYRVVDCGSFYDNKRKVFCKYYFGTGFRSGYIGYLQWIRNYVLVSERLFVFKKSIIKLIENNNGLLELRDDELPKVLAVANYLTGSRAVYDPTVVSIDEAPFHIILPSSDALNKYLTTVCSDVTIKSDPYYNHNLDDQYSDPKMKCQINSNTAKCLKQFDVLELDDYRIN